MLAACTGGIAIGKEKVVGKKQFEYILCEVVLPLCTVIMGLLPRSLLSLP